MVQLHVLRFMGSSDVSFSFQGDLEVYIKEALEMGLW